MTDFDNDFGFTTVGEDVVRADEMDLRARLTKVGNMVLPLLTNLARDPDQEYIKWPNREAKLKPFIAEIKKLIA